MDKKAIIISIATGTIFALILAVNTISAVKFARCSTNPINVSINPQIAELGCTINITVEYYVPPEEEPADVTIKVVNTSNDIILLREYDSQAAGYYIRQIFLTLDPSEWEPGDQQQEGYVVVTLTTRVGIYTENSSFYVTRADQKIIMESMSPENPVTGSEISLQLSIVNENNETFVVSNNPVNVSVFRNDTLVETRIVYTDIYGNAYFSIGPFNTSGNYIMNVTSFENGDYKESCASYIITVSEGTISSKTPTELNIFYEYLGAIDPDSKLTFAYEPINVSIRLVNVSSGQGISNACISLRIYDASTNEKLFEKILVTGTNGIAHTIWKAPYSGNFSIYVYYPGDELTEPSNVTLELPKILKRPMYAALTKVPTTIYVGDSAEMEVSVYDEINNSVVPNITVEVHCAATGQMILAKNFTDQNGIAHLSILIPEEFSINAVGNQTFEVKCYDSNAHPVYASTSIRTTVSVRDRSKVEVLRCNASEIIRGESVEIFVNVTTDLGGKVLGELFVFVNGTFSSKINVSGTPIRILIGSPITNNIGSLLLNITFRNSTYYDESYDLFTLSVVSKIGIYHDVKPEYPLRGTDITIHITAFDELTGEPLNDATLRVLLDDILIFNATVTNDTYITWHVPENIKVGIHKLTIIASREYYIVFNQTYDLRIWMRSRLSLEVSIVGGYSILSGRSTTKSLQKSMYRIAQRLPAENVNETKYVDIVKREFSNDPDRIANEVKTTNGKDSPMIVISVKEVRSIAGRCCIQISEALSTDRKREAKFFTYIFHHLKDVVSHFSRKII